MSTRDSRWRRETVDAKKTSLQFYLCVGALSPVFTLRVQTLDLVPQTVDLVLGGNDVIEVVFIAGQS